MSLENLSPEFQEKAKACQTVEELQELCESMGVELSDEDLNGISGGDRCRPVFYPGGKGDSCKTVMQ